MAAHDWVGLKLEPLDTLFFRDGRPFDAANRVASGSPTPQTLAGAIRTALLARTGFDLAAFGRAMKGDRRPKVLDALRDAKADEGVIDAHFRGPFFALAKGDEIEPLLPMPAVLGRGKQKGTWSRARPKSGLTGWDDPDKLLPLWREVDPDPKAGGELLTLAGLTAFLEGRDPSEEQVVAVGSLSEFDDRVGIVVSGDTLTTVEGQLYAIRLMELNPYDLADGRKVCLYAEMRPGAAGSADYRRLLDGSPVPFGGEGKYINVTTTKAADWPLKHDGTKKLCYLASPTFLPRSEKSRRPLPKVGRLLAAASGPGLAVSGWDVAANGPRATRFAVPAGASYFVEGDVGEDAFLHHENEEERTNLRREGWGFALQGKGD